MLSCNHVLQILPNSPFANCPCHFCLGDVSDTMLRARVNVDIGLQRTDLSQSEKNAYGVIQSHASFALDRFLVLALVKYF